MKLKIGSCYSFINDNTQLIYFKINEQNYNEYEFRMENALFLGDIGVKGYRQTMISFLVNNDIISVMPGLSERTNWIEVI